VYKNKNKIKDKYIENYNYSFREKKYDRKNAKKCYFKKINCQL